MRQHEITAPRRLLDSKGNIAEPGFARRGRSTAARTSKRPPTASRNGTTTW